MIRHVAVLALVILFSGYEGVAHAAPGNGGLAVIDMGTPVSYAFNEFTVSGRNGISGAVTITGTSVDGTHVKLYEAKVGFAESLTATYYAWPELVSVSFDGTDGDGVNLSASARLRWAGADAQAGVTGVTRDDPDAEQLSALEFPFRLQTFGTPLRKIPASELTGGGPRQAARMAVARLFIAGRRAAPLMVLTLWTIAVFVAAWLTSAMRAGKAPTWADPRIERRAVVLTALFCTAGAVTATAFALGSGPAELFAVAAETVAEPVSLVRRMAETGGYRDVSWSLPDEARANPGGLWFMGIRSPQAAAVPVSAFDEYRRLRFKTPPLVVSGPDGRALLAPAPFALAWGLHE